MKLLKFNDFIYENAHPEFYELARELKLSPKNLEIWAEMARRYKQFHKDEKFEDIKLWGLFNWGKVSHLLKTGELKTSYKKENKIIWVQPSKEALDKYIIPLLKYDLKDLTKLAGWKI